MDTFERMDIDSPRGTPNVPELPEVGQDQSEDHSKHGSTSPVGTENSDELPVSQSNSHSDFSMHTGSGSVSAHGSAREVEAPATAAQTNEDVQSGTTPHASSSRSIVGDSVFQHSGRSVSAQVRELRHAISVEINELEEELGTLKNQLHDVECSFANLSNMFNHLDDLLS